MLKRIFILVLVLASLSASRAADPERSVIQIMTFSQSPDWTAPWRMNPVQRSGGSGFVIKGKRIMTNAHVASWAREIIVRRYQDPRPYAATVEFIAHDCDLAVLKVAEESFFTDLEPLEFGDLPAVRSAVITYGYPAGGEEISYTRGVVSRIEAQSYSHSGNRRLLCAQTDAAINPGNSGGPVIQDGRVVGVAFQNMMGLENTGFFIPPPVIERFLTDIADSRYDGVPDSGIRLSPLQNPAYRQLLKLPDNNFGARVDNLLPITSDATDQRLKPDDVLLRVGEFPVASDATILYRGNRVTATMLFDFAQSGGSVPLRLWRDGRELDVQLPVYFNAKDRAAGNQYDVAPRYFVFGGLVFTPLSFEYLKSSGRNWNDPEHRDLTYELFYRPYERRGDARPEPVVLASVLADPVNANIRSGDRRIVDRINGVRIEKLEDVVRAFGANTNATDVIEFPNTGEFECLNHVEAAKANASILKTYAVPQDRRL